MRLLTSFSAERTAVRLGDALYGRGIVTSVVSQRDGEHAVWIHDESQMDAAREYFATFDPDHEEVVELAREARERMKREAKEASELNERNRRLNKSLASRRGAMTSAGGWPPFTTAMIVICVLVYLATGQGNNTSVVDKLLIVPYSPTAAFMYGPSAWFDLWLSEPWRLFTPALVHFAYGALPLHLLFNMMWLKDLGGLIERVFSGVYLVAFIVASAVFSNLTQLIVAGPNPFGGMSGVVYGLLAFLWVRGRYDRSFPLRVPTQVMGFMMIWLVLGFTGVLGGIANGAHVGGLVFGAIWGFVSPKLKRSSWG